jgi:hypothetical protein
MNDHDSVREVAERAGVIDVQMALDDVRDIVGTDPDLPKLSLAVLCFGHVNFEHVRQPAPMRVWVARHCERVAAVDDDEALGMPEEKERNRNLDATKRKCAAVEEVELQRSGHKRDRMLAAVDTTVSPGNSSQRSTKKRIAVVR